MFHTVRNGRSFIGRFEYDDDLLGALQEFSNARGIRAGVFTLIGAVQNIRLGYYDQKKKRYTGCVDIRKKLEIASCAGSISEKDGQIFVHAHLVCADYKGKAFGGHLMPGTKIFAAEYFIQELVGATLVRKKDPRTGLPLWQ